jgi:hypothetical protein
MVGTKISPYALRTLEEIEALEYKILKDKDSGVDVKKEYGKHILKYGKYIHDLSGPAYVVVNYLLKNKKLALSFKRKLEKEHIKLRELEDVATWIKHSSSDKYRVTLFFDTRKVEDIMYQFTTNYKGLIDFIQNA